MTVGEIQALATKIGKDKIISMKKKVMQKQMIGKSYIHIFVTKEDFMRKKFTNY